MVNRTRVSIENQGPPEGVWHQYVGRKSKERYVCVVCGNVGKKCVIE